MFDQNVKTYGQMVDTWVAVQRIYDTHIYIIIIYTMCIIQKGSTALRVKRCQRRTSQLVFILGERLMNWPCHVFGSGRTLEKSAGLSSNIF